MDISTPTFDDFRDEVAADPPGYCAHCGLKLEKSRPDQLVEEGFQMTKARRWDDAIGLYRQAIALDPLNRKALRNIGFVLNRVGRFVEAETFLSTGVELGFQVPTHEAAFLYERAVSRSQLGRHADALTDLDRLLERLPYSVKALYLRARIHQRRRAEEDARRDARQVLGIVPEHSGARRLLDEIA